MVILIVWVLVVALGLILWRGYSVGRGRPTKHRNSPTKAQPREIGLRLVVDIDRSPLTRPLYEYDAEPYYIVIDTETAEAVAACSTELTEKVYTLISLSWQVLSEQGACLSEESYILRQEGCTITPEATAIHGITMGEMLEGTAPKVVLERFCSALESCKALVAHNAAFHLSVLEGQLLRLGREPKLPTEPAQICTMLWGVELGFRRGRMGERVYPSLVELFSYLHYGHLGAEVRYASKPLRDVRLLSACVRKMLRPPYRKHI